MPIVYDLYFPKMILFLKRQL